MPHFNKDMSYPEWEDSMKTFIRSKRLLSCWLKSNAPGFAPPRLPVATTATTFMAKVKVSVEYCNLIEGVTRTTTEDDIDEDILDQWAQVVERNRKSTKKHEDKLDSWPEDVSEVVSYVRASAAKFADSRRAISSVVEDEDELWNLQIALQGVFGDAKAESRTDDLLSLVFTVYKSGDTAEQHNLKIAGFVDRLKRPENKGGFGESIKIDLLGKIFYKKNLAVVPAFASVSEQLAQVEDDKSLVDLMSIFAKAKKNDGPILISKSDYSEIMGKLFTAFGQQGVQKKISKGPKHFRNANLGGASPGEGTGAFVVTNTGNQPSGYPKGNCGLCWEPGHYARECKNTPHPDSRDPRALQYYRSEQQLWAGRKQQQAKHQQQNYLAQQHQHQHQQQDSASNLGGAQMQAAAEFAQLNSLAFNDFVKNCQVLSNVQLQALANFQRTDAEQQQRLKRPLRTKPLRVPKLGEVVEMLVDSGCWRNMGPADEVRECASNPVPVSGESVLTADSSGAPLKVDCSGVVHGKYKNERGLYKEIEVSFRGVENLRKWLWSVPQAIRDHHVVHFEQDDDGGSWLQLHGSCERVPIEFVNSEYFRLQMKRNITEKLTTRQKMEVNFETHCKMAHLNDRILSETARRKMVRNFQYYPNIKFGTDDTCLTKKGQKAPFPKEALWRPKLVGALTRMDCKKIPKSLAKHCRIKYLLTARDSKSRAVRRYYLTGTAGLHQWVQLYRNYIRRKGHVFGHIMMDGEFDTQNLASLAATEPTFDFSFSNPNCQSQNGLSEADVKGWEAGVRAILDHAMRDKKSKVTYKHFPLASEALTRIQNITFNAQAPEMTPFEAVNRIQPDASTAQSPLCRVWYYIYPELRKNVPFSDRRAEGICVCEDDNIPGYRILNLSSNRVLVRRFDDCVFREPHEVFDYAETAKCMDEAIKDGDITVGVDGDLTTIRVLQEVYANADNLESIEFGNDPDESESEETTDSDNEDEAVSADDRYLDVSSDDDESADGDVAHVQKPDGESFCYSIDMSKYSEDINEPVNLGKLPKLVVAQTGDPVPQHIAVNLQHTAKQHFERQAQLKAEMDRVFTAEPMANVYGCLAAENAEICPKSWSKAMKSVTKDKWLAADDVEMQRCKDFSAFVPVKVADIKAKGAKIGHLLRILRVKPDEHRVRWAYDEARAGDEQDFETYASVLRLQTSRLLNLKAAHKGQRVLRGDLTSAFLHVDSEVFYTYYPEGHPESEGGTLCMAWTKLLYGKGNAPRGLRQDMKSTLLALGFEEQSATDQCHYVHKERDIDLGLYVDDLELTASAKQMSWLQQQLKLRYEVKWLGHTCKNAPDSSEKSKTYVGARTEVDPVTKVVTQDQTALIDKMAVQFNFDPTRPRFSPPTHREFPSLESGKTVDPKFHSRYRSKVGCVAHLSVCTRPDVAFHAVYAARRLVDPVPECEVYVDELLQFIFSTAKDKLTFDCTCPLEETLLISSDSSLADAPDGKSTGGWVSLCGGGA